MLQSVGDACTMAKLKPCNMGPASCVDVRPPNIDPAIGRIGQHCWDPSCGLLICLLEFYVLAASKVTSGWVPSCNSAQP